MSKGLHYWEVWYPKAAATGVPLARGLVDPTDTMLFHSAPDVISVEVSDEQGRRLALGQDLPSTQESPICRLRREGDRIVRDDIWPAGSDLGTPVMLPGGEVGILKSWWNAPDHKEWRWQVEFYNSLER
jgi:hypothetical protein